MGAAIAPEVDGLLRESGIAKDDLAAIAVGSGPGPYTSLRVGLMFARAAGWALGVPVPAACSLDIVARGAMTAPGATAPSGVAAPFGVALDARRREVYWARYDEGGRRVAGPLVGKPAEIRLRAPRWFGPGMIPLENHPGSSEADRGGPEALVLAEWVRTEWSQVAVLLDESGARAAAGEEDAVAGGEGWAAPDGDGSGAQPIPQRLLPPRPLYLRRPDAQVPSWLR
jgi:tRNA threonylcarbamoyl adenosine modification protein YeaZ